jgi:Arc/MetJ-type ribon-helix-helix transcriptional regulator
VFTLVKSKSRYHRTMAYQSPPDVDELVREQMATGDFGTEDDVLREALRSLAEQRDDWNAIQVGLKTLDEGNPGVSLDEAFFLSPSV